MHKNLSKKTLKTQTEPESSACYDMLPVCANLLRRGVQVEPLCPICKEEPETVAHMLLTCPAAKVVWFVSPCTIRIPQDPGSFSDGLTQWLAMDDEYLLN